MKVQYRAIAGTSKYVVGSNGSVKNINTGLILEQQTSIHGYKFVGIVIAGEIKNLKVHRLVALAFHANKYQVGLVVDHIDDNRLNNSASNLQWVTTKLNNAKANRPKTNSKQLKHCQYKEIIAEYLKGKMSIVKITGWINAKYNRKNNSTGYNQLFSGKTYGKFWNALTKVERDSVLKITAARTN